LTSTKLVTGADVSVSSKLANIVFCHYVVPDPRKMGPYCDLNNHITVVCWYWKETSMVSE